MSTITTAARPASGPWRSAVDASCLALAVLLGIVLAANGVFMLVSPEVWYVSVPGVTSTGPFNQHFLRDIGLIFVFMGGAFLVGVVRPDMRVALWAASSIWLLGHALFHVWEVAVGICAPSDLVRDFLGVTLPGLIGAALTLWAVWTQRSNAPHSRRAA